MKRKTSIVIIISLVIIALSMIAKEKQARKPLQIIVTNDSHSSIEPTKGKGGFENRMRVVDSLRAVNPNTLLLDAGDIFQGSPYFNLYWGKAEVEGYNILGYDAMTLGNHEFDHGIDTLAARIKEMNFPVVIANFDTRNTPLHGLVKPYTIIEKGGWKVGVIGVSINPKGIVPAENFGNVVYGEPIDSVNKYADILKNEHSCDLVVVLSHLGYEGGEYENATDDYKLANGTRNIDLIMGGHTHDVDSVFHIPNVDGVKTTTLQSSKSGKDVYVITFEGTSNNSPNKKTMTK